MGCGLSIRLIDMKYHLTYDPTMHQRSRPIIISILTISIGILACKVPIIGDVFSTPTATITPTSTPTATPTPTLTPTPTPTPLPVTRIEEGDQARFYGDWDRAITAYQDALVYALNADERATAEMGIGMTYLQAGRYNEALQSLTGILEEYPEWVSLADVYFLRAQASLAIGSEQQAIEDFDQYLVKRPGILDSYIQELVGDALRRLGLPIDAIARYQMAIQASRTGGTLSVEIKIAYALFEAGEYLQAYQKFNETYQISTDLKIKAALNLMAGRALEAIGDYEAAYERYLDALYSLPQEEATYLGLITLVNAGVVVDDFQRGLVDYYAEAYEPALAAFNRVITNSPTGIAYYYRGLTKRELGDPLGGLADFQIALDSYPEDVKWTETWFEKAYTEWDYLSDLEAAALTFLTFVDQAPTNSSAAEALFEAARASERMGALESAASIWLRIPQEYPLSVEAYQAAFLSGVTKFRLGEFSGARDAFLLADGIATQVGERAAARLWVGKTHFAEGDTVAAEENWVRAAVTDPTGYYSERASDMIAQREPFEKRGDYNFPTDLSLEKMEAESWMRESFVIQGPDPLSELDPVLVSDSRIQRGREFWRLGLYESARLEFESLRESYASDAEATYRLMHEFLDLGLYRSAIFAARNILRLAGMDDAATMDAPVYFNYIRFGAYYADLILPEAEKNGLDGLYVLAVVRQESLFEGFAISYADARGLMQVWPPTGEDIARKLSWPPNYSTQDLYRPLVSVVFGTDYLADQVEFFGGDLAAALCAYNAGPTNTLRWKEIAPQDPDLFLEIIRLDQPQRYIRTIFEVFDIYSNLYISP